MRFLTLWKFKIAIILTFAFFCYLGYQEYHDIQNLQTEGFTYVQENRNSKFDLIRVVLSENYQKAQMNADRIAEDISSSILTRYSKEEIVSFLTRLAFLYDYKSDEDNPLIESFGKILAEKYTDLNGVKDDLNLPMVSSLTTIITDYSTLNSTSSPAIRYWSDESKRYVNEYIYDEAIKRIILSNLESPDISSGRLDDIIFWDSRLIQNFPMSTIGSSNFIDSMSIKSLKKIFIENNGDINCFKYLEFGYPVYIYPKKDLAGRPIVDDRGHRRSDSTPLVVIQRFSLYDAIMSNTTVSSSLEKYDVCLKEEKTYLDTTLFWKYFALYSTGLIFLVIQLFTAHVVHVETKRMMQEDDESE